MNGEYPLTDGRGDVRLTTNAARQVTTSNTPDAFGVGSSTPGTSSAYLWNGGSGYRTENVSPLGLGLNFSLQKVAARYYDPTLACFLTRDTYLNQKPYAYCDGDPVNFSDPTGHKKNWWKRLVQWLTNNGCGYNWNLPKQEAHNLGQTWETTGNWEIMAATGGTLANTMPKPGWTPGTSVYGARFKPPAQVMFVIGAGGVLTKGMGMGMQYLNR